MNRNKMRLSDQECYYLYHKKVNEGKTSTDANIEIRNLKTYESDLSIKNKSMERLIEKLNQANEEIVQLKEKLHETKETNFKKGFKELQDSEEEKESRKKFYDNKPARTLELQRIINILTIKRTSLTDLKLEAGMMNVFTLRSGLNFLLRNNIITSFKDGQATWFEMA